MNQTPDLTMYRLIHRGMRTDTARLADALVTLRHDDDRRAAAMASWYQGFLLEFHGHHTVEDTIFFPALAERVAGFDKVVARVDREHAALNDALDAAGAAMTALAAPGVDRDVARHHAAETVAEAGALLSAHLDFEDDEILPLFVRHMSAEEYDALSQSAMKHNGFKALLFAVPWVMSQTTPDEQAIILGEAPLPLRVMWRATRRRYARLEAEVFAFAAVREAVA